MAPSAQKRLLTNPNSKLSKADIVSVLRNPTSWTTLPKDTREHLYTLLPAPLPGSPPLDPEVHPLNTQYKTFIEEALRRFQDDLKEGREVKKWREEAMQAGRDRMEGKFDEFREMEREQYWGRREGVNGVNGEGEGKVEAETEAKVEEEVVKDSEDELSK